MKNRIYVWVLETLLKNIKTKLASNKRIKEIAKHKYMSSPSIALATALIKPAIKA